MEDSDADGEDPEEVNFRLLSEIGKGSLELNSGFVSVVEEGFSPSETEFTPSEFDNNLLEVEGVSMLVRHWVVLVVSNQQGH